jgi:DMSO/TMAO reductase YedYZ heme-binding membrane subunit
MVQLIRVALILLIASSPVLLAAVVLFVRDRLTLRSGMTKRERNQIAQTRSIHALRRWHVFILFCACVSLPFNLADLGHQQARYRAMEAIIAIFFIFRSLGKRSEIQIPETTPVGYTLPNQMSN